MRDRLLRAAGRLFGQSGYAGTSVQAIVDEAGATKPMVYYYFGGKEGLYRELVSEAFGRIYREIEKIDKHEGDIASRLVAVVEANFRFYREAPELALFMVLPVLTPSRDAPRVDVGKLAEANYALIRRIVAEGVGRGELQGNIDHIALSLMGQVLIYQMAQSVVPSPGMVTRESAGHLVRLLLDGARPRE